MQAKTTGIYFEVNIDKFDLYNKIMKPSYLIPFIGLFALMFLGISHDANKIRKNESYVGKQVVIDGDTTTITNFSRGGWGVPYGLNLSNGGLLSPDAVEQFIIE